MKTYYYLTDLFYLGGYETLTGIKTFKAENDEDFVANITRITEKPIIFFSQDRSLVQEFLINERKKVKQQNALNIGIPIEIVLFMQSSGHLINFQHMWMHWDDFKKQNFILNLQGNPHL